MELRITEHGSRRYSFPLGAENPSTVLRVFRNGHKQSYHVCQVRYGTNDRLMSVCQYILSVRNGMLYVYYTLGRDAIRALPLRRIGSAVFQGIMTTLKDQSSHNHGMYLNSLMSLKSITYQFLRRNLSWYPRLQISKITLPDMIAIGYSKILADRWVYEKISPLGKWPCYDAVCSPAVDNHLRHSSTLKQLAKRLFGFSSAWATEKAAGCLTHQAVPWAHMLKGIVSPDGMKKLTAHSPYMLELRSTVRRFLKRFSEDTIIKWVSAEYGSWVTDTARLFNLIPAEMRAEPDGMSLIEYHDLLSEIHRKLVTEDYKLRFKDPIYKIDGAIVQDWQIVVPKTNHELIEWGNQMHNCIASYASLDMGNTVLLGLRNRKEDRLEYCLEVSSRRLRQFKAKYNADASPEIVDVVGKVLKDNGVIEEITQTVF